MIFRRLKRRLTGIIPRPQSLDLYLRHTLGMQPLNEFSERDVFIVGYPKSGNTWFQNLTVGLIYGVDSEYAPDTLVQELVPGVHRRATYYKRYMTPMFFKSHHLPRPEYKRVIYLVRDGRDVMVSCYHHLTALNGTPMDFLHLVQTGDGLGFGKWHDHVERWMANPYNADLITVRYEDLLKDGNSQLKRFCEFVGIERDTVFIQKVIEQNSFAKMQEREVAFGWVESWPKDKFFIRRGEAGSYKDEMPPEVLEVFMHEVGETLRKYGYV